MGLKRILDTSVVLYQLAGRVAEHMGEGEFCISVITELELFSYPAISASEEQQVRTFIAGVTVIGLTRKIREATIRLRRSYALRLPDAIIAATALSFEAELLTNDKHLLRPPGIRARQVTPMGL